MVSNPIHNAPTHLTNFVGREREIAEIGAYLVDSTCRLLTLTGPGGIGKTSLAIQAAAQVHHAFIHEVWFVPLQQAGTPDALVMAVAAVLEIPLAATADPTNQLARFLADRTILLILDNFEHLLHTGGADLLSTLLLMAPGLKLLVTSREALNLREEWRYSVSGLSVPPSSQLEDVAGYSSIQLFVDRARRVQSDFSLADQQDKAVQICQLVEGLPLAIELAAAWTNVLHCDVIAAEIMRSLHFLHLDLRNIADRHRSMVAVFDQSWRLLSPDERGVFARLSVFHGGFRREAAELVVGASLPILATLVQKSLIQTGLDGRYRLHELVRQFAEEQLTTSSLDMIIQTRERHGRYYASFLSERNVSMNGGRQLQAAAEIDSELENVRAAWQWGIEYQQIDLLVGAANALYLFCQFRSRYIEGTQLWEQAVQCLDATTLAAHPDAALLINELGWFSVRLGRLERARALFERAQSAHQDPGEAMAQAHSSDPRLGLGLLASLRGDYAEAQQLMTQARQASERTGQRGNQLVADYFLAGIYLAQGDIQAAQHHAEAAYAAAQAIDNRWFMAYCLNELGNAAGARGAYQRAQHYYQPSYALRKEFADQEGMGIALTLQGKVAMLQQDLTSAADWYQQSLTIYRDINDTGGLVAALDGLGQVACARGDLRSAAQHLSQALQLTANAQLIALRLSVFVSIAQVLLQSGEQEEGRALLRQVQQHASATYEAQSRARRLLEQDGETLPDPAGSGEPDDLETLTIRLLAHLVAQAAHVDRSAPGSRSAQSSTGPLIEPLTPRERELLRLLAAGRSYQEIADQLIIAVGSVKSHAHNIYAKLGVRNRVQAAARAAELDLL